MVNAIDIIHKLWFFICMLFVIFVIEKELKELEKEKEKKND